MLRNLPSATLKQLVKLSERREKIMAQLQDIDREMVRVQKEFGIPTKKNRNAAPVTVSRAPKRQTQHRSNATSS